MVEPTGIILPTYVVYRYTDQIYKIVRFNRSDSDDYYPSLEVKDSEPHTEKSDASFSRTKRVVMEHGLCNSWDYFFTGTIDAAKMDRFDLKNFHSKLSQFIRDMRKKYNSRISYELIPEMHKDGAWHMHGLISGIPKSRLSPFVPGLHPPKLCNRGYLNWEDYAKRFGFCSLSPVRDPVAVGMYITKYVTKDLCSRREELGSHLHYSTHGLNCAVLVSQVIGPCPDLDHFLTDHYDFCSTGLTRMADGLDWTFPLQYDNCSVYLDLFDAEKSEKETRRLDRMIDAVCQLSFV